MRHIVLATVAMAALAGQAFAADLPSTKSAPTLPAPAFSWTGFYGGVEGGLYFPEIDATGFGGYKTVATAGLIGGAIGYNYQFAKCNNAFAPVIGLEGDAGGVFAGSRKALAGNGATVATGASTYDADIRGKLGAGVGKDLLYVAGGLAFGDANAKYSTTTTTFNTGRTGWTVGFGWDHAYTQNLFTRVEYRYADLGSQTKTGLDRSSSSPTPCWSACSTNSAPRHRRSSPNIDRRPQAESSARPRGRAFSFGLDLPLDDCAARGNG